MKGETHREVVLQVFGGHRVVSMGVLRLVEGLGAEPVEDHTEVKILGNMGEGQKGQV